MGAQLVPKADGKPYKVLLAEDKEIAQVLGQHVLEMLGCEVDIVPNGADVVDKARVRDYDLILMDCEMPIVDGYQATQAIRQTERSCKTPIVALTAKAFKNEKERCLEVGMNDYMDKPIREERVCEMINKWCTSVIDYKNQW